MADPPWPYRWTGDSSTPRAIRYPTMGLLEIAELPVSELAAKRLNETRHGRRYETRSRTWNTRTTPSPDWNHYLTLST